MSRKRISTIEIIILIVLFLGLGYAFLTQNLKINGSSSIKKSEWNIYWDNVQVVEGSVEAETPVIDSTKTTVTYDINLNKPGDFYEFTVDAVNDGTIPAKISEIHNKMNNVEITELPPYLEYEVSFSNGDPIEVDHLLKTLERETYKVRIGYKADINASDLPSTPQSLNLSFSVTYVQGEDNTERYLYGFNETNNNIYINRNDSISAIQKAYQTPEEVMAATGKDYFFRFKIKENRIISINPGFKYNNKIYYLVNDDEESYNETTNTLLQLFGESSCERNKYGGFGLYCLTDNFEVGIELPGDYSDHGNVSVYEGNNDYCICHSPDQQRCRCSKTKDVYSFTPFPVAKGDDLSSIDEYYNTPDEVISKTGKNYFLQHIVDSSNKVLKTTVGFKYNDNIYYLNSADDDQIEESKDEISRLFGGKCIGNDNYEFYCKNIPFNIYIGNLTNELRYNDFGELTSFSESDSDYCYCTKTNSCVCSGIYAYKYSYSTTPVYQHDNINSIGTVYDTPEELVAATNKKSYLKHKVSEKGYIIGTEVGFTYNNKYYSLKSSYSRQEFDYNYSSMYNIFENLDCQEINVESLLYALSCESSDSSESYKMIIVDGDVFGGPYSDDEFGNAAVYNSSTNYCFCKNKSFNYRNKCMCN